MYQMENSTAEQITEFFAELVAEVSGSAVPVTETSINNNHAAFTLVPSTRKYVTGYDKTFKSRMWVQASPDDQSIYNLYTLFESTDEEDIYKCVHCKKYKKNYCSLVKVKKLENGETEVWESCQHFDSCQMLLSKIEEIQEKYHRKPGTPSKAAAAKSLQRSRTIAAACPGTNRSRTNRNRTKAKPSTTKATKALISSESRSRTTVAATKTKKTKPGGTEEAGNAAGHENSTAKTAKTKAGQRSRTSIPSSRSRTKGFASTSKTQDEIRSRTTVSAVPTQRKRRPKVMEDFVCDLPVKKTRKTPPSSQSPDTDVFPATITSNPPSSSSTRPLYYNMEQQYLRYQQAAQISGPSTEVPLVAPPPQQTTSTGNISFATRFLQEGEIFLHCVPSTNDVREMCALLNLKYEPQNLLVWHSTYLIDEITTATNVNQIQGVTEGRNIGFQALSAYFLSSEESYLEIQKTLKTYVATNFLNKDTQNNGIILTSLCGFKLDKIHLHALTTIAKIRVAVFCADGIEIYGEAFDSSIPSIILQKDADDIYSAVISVI